MKKSVLCSQCGEQIAEFDDQTNSIDYVTANGSCFTAPVGQSVDVRCKKCNLATRIFTKNGLVFGIDPEDYRLRRNPRLNNSAALICPACGHELGGFSHKAGDTCPYCEMRRNAAELFSKM